MSGRDAVGDEWSPPCPVTDEWVVRPVAGAYARKSYRCPGCDQEIGIGQPHVVSWPEGRADDRRHWHRVCWEARERRRPSRRH